MNHRPYRRARRLRRKGCPFPRSSDRWGQPGAREFLPQLGRGLARVQRHHRKPRRPLGWSEWVQRVARLLYIPFCVAEGIRSITDTEAALHASAEKVSVNSLPSSMCKDTAILLERTSVALSPLTLRVWQECMPGRACYTGRRTWPGVLKPRPFGSGIHHWAENRPILQRRRRTSFARAKRGLCIQFLSILAVR